MAKSSDQLSDEILMAYADGLLSAAERAKVESLLAADPEARTRLAAFSNTRDMLGQMFDKPMHEPVPKHLLDIISAASARSGATPPLRNGVDRTADASGGLSLDTVLRKFQRLAAPRTWGPVAGVAAAAALVIVSYNLHLKNEMSSDGNQAAVHKDQPLEREPLSPSFSMFLSSALRDSSESIRGKQNEAFDGKIVMTFRDHGGQFCRQYEVGQGASPKTSGIACLGQSGDWVIQAERPTTPTMIVSDKRTQQPVSVPAQTTRHRTIDQIVDEMIDGQALSLEEEAALIKSNWRVKK